MTMVFIQFAFLRKVDVNKLSFRLVLWGSISLLISESIVALVNFYGLHLPYNEIYVILIYGLSQYLIVVGITKEIKKEIKQID